MLMLTKKQFFDGIVDYITSDVLNLLSGYQLFLAATAINVIKIKAESDINSIDLSNKYLVMFDVTAENGLINVDTLCEAAKHAIQKTPLKLDLKKFFLGEFTFKEKDIDSLHNRLKSYENA